MTARLITRTLIPTAVAACTGQLIWFSSKAIRQIDYDGIAYAGIAEQIRLGHVRDSLNAFRSPLVSWLIAIVPRMTPFVAGKFITVSTLLLTLVILYFLTFYLWHSRTVAATAILLMILARGVNFFAVAFITPDFLLSALVLSYFLVVLRSLREDQNRWWLVGFVHGIAFLAKAIALPWLAVCTVTAAAFSPGSWKTKFVRLASASVFPILIAILWGSALHARYEVFTLGSQFKANLLQWNLRGIAPQEPSRYKVLSDVAEHMNGFADDPMPPGSWEWSYQPSMSLLIPRILAAETRNLPKAAKDLALMSTPGILLAVFSVIFALHKHHRGSAEWILAITIALGSVVLVLAYSMLVIDTRYLFPPIALLFTVGARGLWPDWDFDNSRIRKWCITLTVIGIGFSLMYWSSPFRTQTRDWQVICREAGYSLRLHRVATTVSIGSGPFPEHGVGWEAGYTSSYFGRARLLAASESSPQDLTLLEQDMMQALPDAVLVWDSSQQVRASILQALRLQYSVSETIIDPQLGEVGIILYRKIAC